MAHTPHELAADFPEFSDELHKLKMEDTHFKTLADRYHNVNRAVHRAEANIEPTADEHISDMRKQRMSLKDEIYNILKTTKARF